MIDQVSPGELVEERGTTRRVPECLEQRDVQGSEPDQGQDHQAEGLGALFPPGPRRRAAGDADQGDKARSDHCDRSDEVGRGEHSGEENADDEGIAARPGSYQAIDRDERDRHQPEPDQLWEASPCGRLSGGAGSEYEQGRSQRTGIHPQPAQGQVDPDCRSSRCDGPQQ